MKTKTQTPKDHDALFYVQNENRCFLAIDLLNACRFAALVIAAAMK